MCENMIELGYPFYTESGANRRSWVHIDDLMKLYIALVEAAVAGGGKAVWGKEVSSHSDYDAPHLSIIPGVLFREQPGDLST